MKLTILGTSDLHGDLWGYDYAGNRETPSGGMARLYTYLCQVRAENPNTLLLDAGDIIQGTPLTDSVYNQIPDQPHPLLSAMNFMGYDAVTLGNHDFDWGVPTLRKIFAQAHFPVLTANVLDASGNFLTGKGWQILSCGGIRVAVIGVVTPAVPLWDGGKEGVADCRFLPAADAVRNAITQIGPDADLFVVSAHMGLYPEFDEENGSDSARAILERNPEITVLQTAHNHAIVRQRQGRTLIGGVRDGGRDVARFDLTLNEQGQLLDSRMEIVDLTDIPPSEAFRALPFVRQAHARTLAFSAGIHSAPSGLDPVIGLSMARFLPEDRSPGLSLLEDTAVTELIHAVQRSASGADVSAVPLYSPEADLPAGEIHASDIAAIYPFANLLYRVPITGAELKAYMEWSAAAFQGWDPSSSGPVLAPDTPSFRYDTFSGVEYEIDLRQPVGRRIRNLLFHGQPLQGGQKLTLAVNNFRYASVLKSEGLISGKREWCAPRPIPELLTDYVRTHSPLHPPAVRSWKIVGFRDDTTPPEKGRPA